MAGQQGRSRSGISMKKFALTAGPAFLAAGVVLAATAQGALAASFAVAGTNFKISADKLEGTGMNQFGTLDVGVDGERHPVAVNGFKSAKLYSMCQSMVIPTPFQAMTIKLTAGSETEPVTATNMVAGVDLLLGDVVFEKPNIGIDASVSQKGPIQGERGAFALEAERVLIDDAKLQAWSATAGTFVLKGLKITAAFGKDECF